MSSSKISYRSLLFTPGDSLHKIRKAAQLNADAVVLDLEDAVAVGQKVVARQTVADALTACPRDRLFSVGDAGAVSFPNSQRLVRINAITTPFWQDDLAAILPARPDGVVVPKAETAVSLQHIAEQLTHAEKENGWPNGSIRLLPLVETALGIMNLKEIAQASSRLDNLLLGAEDLAADIGAIRTVAGWEMFYARSAIVTTAAAFGLQAMDIVFTHIHDEEGLRQECEFARQLGFVGKMAIHPHQVETINHIFSPSAAEIEAAQVLVTAFERHVATGKGVFVVNGRMVDMPIVRAAQRILGK